MANGSWRRVPTEPAAAAVVSLLMMEPRKVPCRHENASFTSGITPARRPPNRIAEIGTPAGFSHSGEITGHWRAGTVKRALGCAALRLLAGVHWRRSQSVASGGGASVMSSHHTSPSGVIAQFVNTALLAAVRRALGLLFMLV